jgi:hypothetical protein
VEFQVEKDPGTPSAQRLDDGRPLGGEQLAADLEEVAALPERIDERECLSHRRDVQRDDRLDRHVGHCSEPVRLATDEIPCCRHQ